MDAFSCGERGREGGGRERRKERGNSYFSTKSRQRRIGIWKKGRERGREEGREGWREGWRDGGRHRGRDRWDNGKEG